MRNWRSGRLKSFELEATSQGNSTTRHMEGNRTTQTASQSSYEFGDPLSGSSLCLRNVVFPSTSTVASSGVSMARLALAGRYRYRT